MEIDLGNDVRELDENDLVLAGTAPGGKETSAPQSSAWAGCELPHGYTLDGDGVWFQPPPKKTKDPTQPPPEPYLICGPCWVVAESRRYNSKDWGLHIRFVDKDNAGIKERNLPQFELTKSTQSARDLVATLSSEGLYMAPKEEPQVVLYLRSFNSALRRRWTDQIGWIETDEMKFVLPEH